MDRPLKFLCNGVENDCNFCRRAEDYSRLKYKEPDWEYGVKILSSDVIDELVEYKG